MSISALILAAGKSTRLGSLGLQKPKPLLPVLGRPLLEWNTHRLRQVSDIIDIRCNASHLSEQVVALSNALDISCSVEPDILGTGGGIANMARQMLSTTDARDVDAFLCHNGKVMSDIDFTELISHHVKTESDVTLTVSRAGDTLGLPASIGVDKELRVRWIRHRKDAVPTEAFVFTGVHLFSRDIVAQMPAGPHCLIDGTYRPLLEKGARISAYVHPGYYHEHSSPKRYLLGNMRLLQHMPAAIASVAPVPAVTFPNTSTAWITDPSQSLARACENVNNVVIGKNTSIPDNCKLNNAVVWDDSVINHVGDQTLTSCIITPNGIIQADI